MKIIEMEALSIPEVKVIHCQRFPDERGFFTETYRESDLQKVIPKFSLKQINESHSKKGVLRGLHMQWNPYQGKLVRTFKGHMADIVLDIRKNSPTYGKVISYDMPISDDKEKFEMIWVPVGFAHGNIYFEDSTIEYYCTSEYSPGNEAGINPLSPDLDWSLCDPKLKAQIDSIINEGLVISDKDKKGLSLDEWTKDPKSDNFVFGNL